MDADQNDNDRWNNSNGVSRKARREAFNRSPESLTLHSDVTHAVCHPPDRQIVFLGRKSHSGQRISVQVTKKKFKKFLVTILMAGGHFSTAPLHAPLTPSAPFCFKSLCIFTPTRYEALEVFVSLRFLTAEYVLFTRYLHHSDDVCTENSHTMSAKTKMIPFFFLHSFYVKNEIFV